MQSWVWNASWTSYKLQSIRERVSDHSPCSSIKQKQMLTSWKQHIDAVLKESSNSSSTSSVLERYSNPLSRLEKFEHEIDSLDDDGLLSQSSTRIRDDVSVTTNMTARYPTSRRCSPSMNEIPEASNPERSSFSNKTPPLPPGPEYASNKFRIAELSLSESLFLSECHTTKPMLSKFLNSNNENPLSMGMSTASLFRPINIDNTLESKTEVKHSDKNFAKPETTVAKTRDDRRSFCSQWYNVICCWSQSTSSSLKQTMIHSSRLVL